MGTKVATVLDFSTAGAGVTGLSDPTGATDAANKRYVDNIAQGLSPKGSVKLGTAAALPGNTYANGAAGVGATLTATTNALLAVDGVNVQVNDRILVKNEATAANNGIYIVTAAGSGGAPYILTRTTDMDDATEIQGAYTYVEAGNTLAGTVWGVTTTGAIVVGTTALAFTQLAGPGEIIAGTGIAVSGNTVSLQTPVAVANGGTGQGTAAAARGTGGLGAQAVAPTGAGSAGVQTIAAEGIATGVIANVGDGAATTITITHNLGTKNVIVQVWDHTTGAEILCDITRTSTNVVTLGFSAAPAASAYDVAIMAIGV